MALNSLRGGVAPPPILGRRPTVRPHTPRSLPHSTSTGCATAAIQPFPSSPSHPDDWPNPATRPNPDRSRRPSPVISPYPPSP
eukprot:scaffold15674_cov91-Isochrysis_galbana.AAC.2